MNPSGVPEVPLPVLAFGILAISALCYFGYRIAVVFARIECAFLLGALGWFGGNEAGIPALAWGLLATGLVVGFLVGRVALRLSMALNAFCGGALLGWFIGTLADLPPLLTGLGLGLAMGVLEFVFYRAILILMTALPSGVGLGYAFGAVLRDLGVFDPARTMLPVALCALFFVITGAAFQIKNTAKMPPPPQGAPPLRRPRPAGRSNVT